MIGGTKHSKSMNNKAKNKVIDQETLQIITDGSYINTNKDVVDISSDLNVAVTESVLYLPDDISSIKSHVKKDPKEYDTVFEFLHCTTLGAAQKIIETFAECSVVVLNFASAKNPGGGFLKGANAQEESLARASGLYACLNQDRMSRYYSINRQDKTCLYTHSIIYSPLVPVIRDDDNELLDKPYKCSFITAPAVNANHARERVKDEALIESTMKERICRILSIAAYHNHDIIILGAWGCGVFGNYPHDIARMFRHYLIGEGAKFKTTFSRVYFAVTVESMLDEMRLYFLEPNPPSPQGRGSGRGRGRGRGRGNKRKEARTRKENVQDDT